MSVTVESLKVFCDVVRQKSFSRGAAINQVSQSAASQMISHLEKRLGVQLIDRSKRPLALTPEGEVYYEGCQGLVEQYSVIEGDTQALHQAAYSSVSVASIYSVGLYDMNEYVREFRKIFPRGSVRIHYHHPDKVYDSVLSGETDLGLVSFPRSTRELEIVAWREEPMVLVCAPTNRMAQERSIRLEQIDGEDFVAFDAGLEIRRQVDQCLREHRAEVNIVMEFDNIEAIKRGVEIGAGVAILPEPTLQAELSRGSLAAVALEGRPLMRPLGIIHRRGRVLTPAMISFMDLLKHGLGRGESGAQAMDLPAVKVNNKPKRSTPAKV